jgi:hypothetical protein
MTIQQRLLIGTVFKKEQIEPSALLNKRALYRSDFDESGRTTLVDFSRWMINKLSKKSSVCLNDGRIANRLNRVCLFSWICRL